MLLKKIFWIQLTNNLQFFDSLLIETLLFGDDSLSEEQNAQIFKSVQLYIKQTKRFTKKEKKDFFFKLYNILSYNSTELSYSWG
jgi:hypothetical protein